MPVPGSPAVNSLNRNKTCPSPSFDARVFKNAKWSSTEDISFKDSFKDVGSFKDLPQTWVPRNLPSPSPDRKDFKPLNFDSNSLRRSKRSNSTDSGSVVNLQTAAPAESFAWKDSTLDRQLKDLQNRKFSDPPDPKEGRQGDNDSGLSNSLDKWASKPLPKSEDPDVILLKKARQEKKVKRYLEDNFQNREGNYSSGAEYDSDIGALSSKYTSLDKRRENDRSSPPKSPPPFSKAESRYEREQRIKVGSLESFTPGGTLSRDKSLSPPPAASSAQNRYEKERFRVQPGRIENYRIGKGSLASQEAYKAGLTSSVEACGITKYSGSHSYNPLLTSKSVSNLAIKKGGATENNHLQKTLKDGYESDSTLSYRKHHYNPGNPSPQAKALYTQVQKGGEVPLQGLRMQAPEKKDDVPSIQTFQQDHTEQDTIQRPNSSAGSTLTRDWNKRTEQALSEEEIRLRQKQQLNKFYQDIETQKENQLKVDTESRKHHDTLLPGQKSPVPLNRYDEEDVNGNQTLFLNAGKKPSDCKMVSKAIFSFQAQNNRELSFKKGDVIYIKKQVDSNWYEGERNSNVGIFPTTYVEILPNGGIQQVTTLPKKEKTYDGAAKAKFNFTAQTPMELSLIKGETISLTRRIDNNWFEGRVGSRKGILPVAYVDIISEPGEAPTGQTKPAASPAAHSILKNGTLPQSSYIPQYEKPKSYLSASPYSTLSRPTSSLSNGGNQNNNDGKPEPIPFRALYNYKPQNDDEVELSEGDIVYVMEKCDDGWFVGTSQRTGIFGTFPGNYVTHI